MKSNEEERFKAWIVHLIVSQKPEEALIALNKHFSATQVTLKVGRVKGHSGSLGCYVAKNKTIYVSSRESLFNPYVLLHEYYHHIRFQRGRHRGAEKYASRFALNFVECYEKYISELRKLRNPAHIAPSSQLDDISSEMDPEVCSEKASLQNAP